MLGERLHDAGLRQDRDVGWIAALDARPDVGGDVVARRAEAHGRAGLLSERVEDHLEAVLLRAGPGGRDLDGLTAEVDGFVGRDGFVLLASSSRSSPPLHAVASRATVASIAIVLATRVLIALMKSSLDP